MAETEDGTQALAKKSTPVRAAAEGILLTIRAHPLYPCQSVFSSGSPMQSAPARHANSNGDPIDYRLSIIGYRLSPITYNKPSAIQGEARLRGLYWIIHSKTILPS